MQIYVEGLYMKQECVTCCYLVQYVEIALIALEASAGGVGSRFRPLAALMVPGWILGEKV